MCVCVCVCLSVINTPRRSRDVRFGRAWQRRKGLLGTNVNLPRYWSKRGMEVMKYTCGPDYESSDTKNTKTGLDCFLRCPLLENNATLVGCVVLR